MTDSLSENPAALLRWYLDAGVDECIAEAPVAFECVLHEKLETESRYVFIGRVLWLHARDGLVDTETWRVRLQDYHPVGRFGASFYVTTRDRFAIDGQDRESRASTAIDEI